MGGGPGYLDAFPQKEALSSYDVVFVGDVGLGNEGLSVEQCDMLAGLVRDQASGLILMPGLGGGHSELARTELGELFPVHLEEGQIHGHGDPVPSPLVLTEAGRSSASRSCSTPRRTAPSGTTSLASSGTRPCAVAAPGPRCWPCTARPRTNTAGFRSS